MPGSLPRSVAATRRATAIAIGIALASNVAWAQSSPAVPSDAEAKAEARFRDGSQAFDAGRVEEACLAFEESLHIYPTLGTLLNLALCHEKEGKTATAWREFSHAAAWASEGNAGDRRDFAHQHAVHLERILSRVVVENGSGAPSIALEIDGATVDSQSALPLFLDPGSHAIAARAPGRKRYEITIAVPAVPSAEALVVRIPPLEAEAPAPAAVTPQATTLPPSHSIGRTAGWVVGGIGIALVVTGASFGIDALSQLGHLESPCNGSCDLGSAKTAETISLVTLSAGAVALAAGGWLLWAKSSAASSSSPRATLLPEVTTRGAGIRIAGAW